MLEPHVFAVDIDGVACAHAESICRYVSREYSVECCAEAVTSWDHDFGPITFTKAVAKTYRDPHFVLGMDVVGGFAEFLSEVSQRFHVLFVSAREEYCHHATREWLRRHFGQQDVIFVRDKARVSAFYLLDDNPDDALSFAAHGKEAFLLKRPWNDNRDTLRRLSCSPDCHFVSSFDQVLAMLSPVK